MFYKDYLVIYSYECFNGETGIAKCTIQWRKKINSEAYEYFRNQILWNQSLYRFFIDDESKCKDILILNVVKV